MNNDSVADHQAKFDEMYISASEIEERLKVNRCSITFAHQRGSLPQPIVVGDRTNIWLRAEAEPFIRAWEKRLLEVRAKRKSPTSTNVAAGIHG